MKIIEFLKKLIKVKNNDLSFLKDGDIIWAKRYQSDEEKNKLEVGHQESPFVIIKKDKKKVYALQCTSNPHGKEYYRLLYYPLGRLRYNLDKNTYINCISVYELKKIQYVENLGHLSNYDLNQLKKQLYIVKNKNISKKLILEDKYLDFKIGIGDIIVQDNKKYYIYSADKKYFYTYKLRKQIKKNFSFLINNNCYSFVFDRTDKISLKSEYYLDETFNSGEIEIINMYKEKFLRKVKSLNENILKIGSLIEYKEKLYYIYNLDNEYIYVYRVYTDNVKNSKIINIKINGGIYKTSFMSVNITKESLEKNGFNVKRYADNDEINEIIESSEIPIQEHDLRNVVQKNKIERTIDDFVPMTILINENNNEYYLIISKDNNIIELVNINDLGDTFYFELESDGCPFKYYRILSKEEFDIYLSKIKELKDMVLMFNK